LYGCEYQWGTLPIFSAGGGEGARRSSAGEPSRDIDDMALII